MAPMMDVWTRLAIIMVPNSQHLLESHVMDGYHTVLTIVPLNARLSIAPITPQAWVYLMRIVNSG